MCFTFMLIFIDLHYLNIFNNKLVLQKVQKAWWLKAITSIELSLISNMGVAWCGSLYPVLYSKHGGSLKWLPDSFTINIIDTARYVKVLWQEFHPDGIN